MEKLDWGKRLVFANVREYYETLGFLCKEKEVIKVYIEDNRKAGARGIQGRLRIVEGNYKSFPNIKIVHPHIKLLNLFNIFKI